MARCVLSNSLYREMMIGWWKYFKYKFNNALDISAGVKALLLTLTEEFPNRVYEAMLHYMPVFTKVA